MARFTPDQLEHAATLTAPLDREGAVAFLKAMDIRMSVGHWSAGDFVDRFAPLGYQSDDAGFGSDFESQCRRTRAAGIGAIEIHQTVFQKTPNGDVDWAEVERARDGYLPELDLSVTTCNINTWTNPRFRLGGVCNPDPALRREALEEFHKAIEICKRLDIGVVGFWPGSDGADYHFQIDYLQSLEWFTVVHGGPGRGQRGVHGGRRPPRHRAEALRAARAVHDRAHRGLGHPGRVTGQPGVRRRQLRAHRGLRAPEDGGHDGRHRL